MGNLLNSGYQNGTFRAYRADGSLISNSPKLILPQATSRSMLSIQNAGTGTLYVEYGCARATATLTNGVVTAITILNPGFGFTRPPHAQFKGGGAGPTNQFLVALTASGWDGRGQIDNWPTPAGVDTLVTPPIYYRPAKAKAVLTSGVVTSFLITDGGAGYINPPEVLLVNDPLDPFGCADPSYGGGSGTILYGAGADYWNGTFCPTDAVAIYGSAATVMAPAPYVVKYAP
jgi:hypothetical protein